MPAEIINLRRARKEKARGEREKQAERNRASFGLSKGEKERARAEGKLAERKIESHRRESREDR
jgi:hypothetical protein